MVPKKQAPLYLVNCIHKNKIFFTGRIALPAILYIKVHTKHCKFSFHHQFPPPQILISNRNICNWWVNNGLSFKRCWERLENKNSLTGLMCFKFRIVIKCLYVSNISRHEEIYTWRGYKQRLWEYRGRGS